jgi:hypothetical protein
MIVLVDLDRSQLSLINNVLVRKGAEVEPVVQANGMRRSLPEDIQLPLEIPFIKLFGIGDLGSITGSICGLQHNEGLQNDRLSGLGSRPEERGIYRRLSPPQDLETQRLGNIFQLPLGFMQRLLIGLEEKVSHSVLAQGRKLDANLTLEVLDEELVRDRRHNTCAITVACIGADSTAVCHVAQ